MLGDVRAKSAAVEASGLAASYLERFEQSGAHSTELAQRLCEFATASDPLVAAAGTDAIFRTNHASNYLPLAGRLPRDRDRILEVVDDALRGNIPLRPEWSRGL